MAGFGAKVFKPNEVSESNCSGMPEEFREAQRKRFNRRLADYAGLKNFGVNLIRVIPGGQSSARHAHTKQDEFVYVLEGEFVLVTDNGPQTVGPSTCIGFPAGTGDGHHFLNETDRDAIFLVVGDRAPSDDVTYSDIDLEQKVAPTAYRNGATRRMGRRIQSKIAADVASPARHPSESFPKQRSADVCHSAAVGGIPDIQPTDRK